MLLACLCGSMVVSSVAMAEDRLVRDAQQYFDKGELNAAIIQLKNALQRQPDHAEARLLLGRSHLELGDGASAEKELDRAASLGVDSAILLPLLGKAWLLQGKTDRVLEEIDGAELSGEALADHLYLRGQAFSMRGDPDQAESHFAKALGAYPGHVDSLVGQARLLFARGDAQGARERLDRALGLSRDHADAWALDGELQRQAGNLEAAEDRFNRTLALQPRHLGAYLGRAAIYIDQGRFDLAERDIGQVLRRSPRHPIAHYLLGLAAYQQGKHDEAVSALEQTLGVLPGHASSLVLMGTIRYQQGQYHQSIQHLRPFMMAYPEHVPGAKLLAAALLRTQQAHAAIELLEATARLAPEDAQLLAMLGSAYLESGDGSKGLDYLRRAAELAPDAASIQAKMGIAHILAGDARQATDDLEAAVNLGQGLWQADILLVVTYLNNGEVDKALAAARALQAKLPDDPMPFNLLGAVFLQKGDPDAARNAFGQALSVRPGFAPAKLNLARMDINDGQLERARSKFLEVLAADEASLDAMYGMTDLAHLQGQPGQVEQWLQRARKHHPQAVKPSVLLAEYFLRVNQPLKALDVARALNEHQPNQPDALRVLGLAQMATDSNAAGVATFKRLAELLPDNVQVQYLLGSAAVKHQDLGMARAAFRKVLELEAHHAGALFSLGSIHLGANEHDQAARYAKLLLEQHAGQPWGYALSADMLASEGEYAAAAIQAREAYGHDPSQSRLLRYHHLLKQSDARQEAAELLEAWLQQHPLDASVHLLAAMDLQELGKPRVAMDHYEKVLAQHPGNVIALNNLAWLYLEEDPKRALRHAEQAYQASPDRPEVLDTYGWALVRNGEAQKGLTFLQDALVKAPHLAQIRYHTAVALHKTGRDREARLELEQALRSPAFEGRDAALVLYESLK